MLTIRQLFYTLSGLYIVLLFAGLVLVRWVWFYPQEMNRYLQHQQNELQSLATALEIRREQLQANANDYGHWNETWNYILQDTPAYLADNFTASSMSTLNLDAVMILSHEFSIRLSQQLNSAAHRIEPSPVAFHKWLSEYTIRNDIFNSSPAQDVVRIDNTPYLLAISPVMKTDHSGPQAGWLLFFQKIDDALLKSLSRITRITLQEIPLPDAQSNAIMPLELPIYTAATQHQRCIYNSRQEPAFCLELTHSTFSMPVFISPGTLVVYLLLTLIPVLLFAMLMHLLTGPIRKATQLLQRNNFDGLLRPVLFSSPLRVKELRQLRDAFNELVYTTRQQQARLEQLSNTDRLTGIPNRRAFDEALDNTWRRISRHQQQVALILADIDYFKPFNDHYGHQAGDDALHKVAQALKGCARRTDEIAARFGGEEFVILLYADTEEDIEHIRERISQAVHNLAIPHQHSKVASHLTISFGIAWIRNSGPWLEDYAAEEWLHAADAALYAAKGAGRDCSMLQIISPQQPFTDSPEYQISPR